MKIPKITFENFNEYAKDLFKQVYVEGILYGNMTEKQAQSVVSKLLTTLGNKPYLKGKNLRPQAIMLSNKKGPLFQNYETKAQGNAAILAIENEEFSSKKRPLSKC